MYDRDRRCVMKVGDWVKMKDKYLGRYPRFVKDKLYQIVKTNGRKEFQNGADEAIEKIVWVQGWEVGTFWWRWELENHENEEEDDIERKIKEIAKRRKEMGYKW